MSVAVPLYPPRTDAKHTLLSTTITPDGWLIYKARTESGVVYESRVELPFRIEAFADPLLALCSLILSRGPWHSEPKVLEGER